METGILTFDTFIDKINENKDKILTIGCTINKLEIKQKNINS